MRRRWGICLLALCLLCGCADAGQPRTSTFFAMDTVMDVTIYGEEALLSDVREMIADLEAKVSVTDRSSELYAINQKGAGKLTGAGGELMRAALALCRRTGGALDISVYPVVREWGFTTGEYQVPDQAAIDRLLAGVDYTRIRCDGETGAVVLPDGMQVDLGSVAKGYAGSLAAGYLREKGVGSALLNLGGNIQAVGGKPDGTPWKIAVKDPGGDTPMIVLLVEDQAVVTSGGYERYFQRDGKTYWHIMDPSTGRPAERGLLSVTVVGEDGLVCDGLSTALFVMGLEKAAAFWQQSRDFEAVFVTDRGELYLTAGLASRFALTEDHQDAVVYVIER